MTLKPFNYYHIENCQAKDELGRKPNPYPLAQFSKPVSDYLSNLIWFHIEDTGNLPTATEYFKMCRSALENAHRR